jgi:cytochrome c553
MRTVALGVLLMIAAMEVRADMIDSTGVPPHEHCALCHGLDGISRMAKFPKLAGQRYDYLAKQLGDFKAARRTNDGGPMAGITHQFEMAPLLEAAKWFSQQPDPPPVPSDREGTAAGRALFEGGKSASGVPACVSCHGADARTALVAPRLEAQHPHYLEKQLGDFRTKERANDPDGVMRRIAAALTDEEIEVLARYLASQPRTPEVRP